MLLLPLLSVAVGASNVQAVPSSMVLFVLLQVITGAVVSTTRTVWLQRLKLPQASVACQERRASKVLRHWRAALVTELTIVIVVVAPMSLAVGASKIQTVARSATLLVLLQVITGA